MTQKWQRREISNFEYLMFLNTIAGKTYSSTLYVKTIAITSPSFTVTVHRNIYFNPLLRVSVNGSLHRERNSNRNKRGLFSA